MYIRTENNAGVGEPVVSLLFAFSLFLYFSTFPPTQRGGGCFSRATARTTTATTNTIFLRLSTTNWWCLAVLSSLRWLTLQAFILFYKQRLSCGNPSTYICTYHFFLLNGWLTHTTHTAYDETKGTESTVTMGVLVLFVSYTGCTNLLQPFGRVSKWQSIVISYVRTYVPSAIGNPVVAPLFFLWW